MSEKKNIDRLFQEKFKDFEAAPPEHLWQNIEAELQKKKKRRVIPLWFKLSGVAAVFIIGLLLMFPFKETGSGKNPVVIDNNNDNANEIIKEPTINSQIKTEEVLTQGNEASDKSNVTDVNNREVSSPVNNNKTGGTEFSTSSGGRNNAVAYGDENRSNKINNKRKTVKSGVKESQMLPAINEGLANNNVANRNTTNKNSSDINAVNNAVQKEASQNDIDKVINNNTQGIAVNADSDVKNNGQNTIIPATDNSRAVEDGINNNQLNNEALAVTETPADSTTIPPANELEDLLKKKQDEEKEKAVADAGNKEKWNLRPQLAPLFYSSMSEGSPIDAQFASNSKSYDADMSYGVGIDYALNDRISIRSGINNVNLSYSTNDVSFHPSLSEQTNNIAAKGATANIVVENQSADGPGIMSFAANSFATQKFNGSMQQEMGYIEVPLEMSYKLLNKKFGIELIGGMSTLFLNNNNVSVLSDQGYRSEIGEASNLNDVSFSANAGIGFKYRFLKMFEASFEPTFKYQVNTFSNNAGNFKPYFIGLYSGISFRF